MSADPSAAWRRHLGGDAPFAPSDLIADGSLPALWARRWAEDGSRVVLRDGVSGATFSAALLEARTRDRAGILAAYGIRPGDRVLLSAASTIELVEWHVGALRLGAVAVPTNPGYQERELVHVVHDSDPVAIFVDQPDRASWAAAAARSSTVVITPESVLPAAIDVPLDLATAEDPALLPYTSGTTGTPKGALLSHGNLLSSVSALCRSWRWTSDDVLLLALPLFHMHGLGVGLHGTLAAGATAVVYPSFDAATILGAIDDRRATLFFGVPTMYARVTSAADAARLRALRLCVSGSAPLAAEIHRRIEEISGQRVLERYGMTETVMNLSNPYDGDRRPGTVGFELPGVEVILGEADDDAGEILLRGPNVFHGYWRRPDATAESFTDDGWFRSGDLAERDSDGYYRIVGRSKELIISGGFNVYPREIEDVLLELPGVKEVAVVGTPSLEWGEVVTACIVPEGGPIDEAVIAEFCSTRLVSYKRPRLFRFLDQLPRNAMGKIVRSELVE